MSGSILVDWQVACELGLKPQEMRSFLNAMEALRRPDTDNMNSIRALGELARLERWVHIYVLPVACQEMLRPEVALDAVEALRRGVIDPIIASVEGNLRGILTELVGDVFGDKKPQDLLSQCEKAAVSLAESKQDSTLSAISEGSYLDIEEYDVAALILSLVLAIAPSARNEVAAAFGRQKADTATSTALGALLLRVLRGEEGRWCRLLAIDLGLAVPEIVSLETVKQSLLTASRKGMATAPDLLQRAARLALCADAGDAQQHKIIIDQIYSELVTFNHWQSLAGRLLGSASRPDDVRTSLVYWQDALWHIMAEIDANEAAKRLEHIWQPRVFENPAAEDKISVPVQGEELAGTVRLYRLLGHQHVSSNHIPLFVTGQPDEASPYWWALSPWLVADPPVGPRGPYRNPRPRPQILACAAAASFGARLLLRSDPNSDSAPWRLFAAQLLHALHELRQYRYVEERVEQRLQKADRNLFVLAHVCRAAAEKIAGGRSSHPSPQLFIDLVADAAANGLNDGRSRFGGVIDSKREANVVNSFLASCLRLTQYAMGAAADGGRKRWLALVGELTSIAGHEHLDEPDGYMRKLLMRFLLGTPLREVAIDHGLDRIKETNNWGKVQNRLLLLIPTDNAAEWKLSGMPEDVLETENTEALFLSLACQRAAAAIDDTECEPELRRRWLQDFQLRLDAVKTEKPLDRFLRLRLIELLRNGSFSAEEDLVIVIASRLIEFGSALDLRLMGEWLTSESVDTKQKAEVRRRLFLGLVRYRRHRAEVTSVTDRASSDPDARIDAEKRRELLDRLVACCITPADHSQRDIATNARSEARRDRDAVLAGRLVDTGIVMPLTMDRASRLRFEGGEERQGRAMVVAVDQNSERVSFLDSIGAERNVLDLFSGVRTDAEKERFYLGVIDTHDAATEAEGNVLVRVAERQHIPVRRGDFADPPEFGELVALRHGPVREANAWRRDLVSQVERLPFSQDSLFLLAEVDLPTSEPRRFQVSLHDNNSKINWTNRTENFLALYGGLQNKCRYKVWVAKRNDETDSESKNRLLHEPATLDLVDLLLDYQIAGEGARCVILCLHELRRDIVGTLEAVIVEVMPLQIYRLNLSTDLTAFARAELKNRIALLEDEGRDTAGLLIAMKVECGLEGPRLDLVRAGTAIQSIPEYSVELANPFDDRNIRWRALFEEEEADDDDHDSDSVLLSAQLAALAGRQTLRAVVPDHVIGFPTTIDIDLRGGQRIPFGDGVVYVWLEPNSWNPRTGRAHGEIAKANALKLPRDPPEETIRKLFNLKHGDIVDLMRFGALDEKYGTVAAYTPENLRVKVVAASLSMKPIVQDQVWKSAGSTPRQAQLSGSRQWNRSEIIPKVPVEALPEGIRDGGKGILVSLPAISDRRAHGGITGSECEVAWLIEGAVVRRMLPIENFSEFRRPALMPGTRVIVTGINGRPEIRFEVPNLLAEALWQEVTSLADQDLPYPVGSARISGRDCEIYEISGGRFFADLADRIKSSSLDHQKSTLPHRHVRDVSAGRAQGPFFNNEKTQRSVIQYDDTNARLCGLRRNGDPVGDAKLLGSDILLKKLEEHSAKFFTLKRRFRLQSQQRPIPSEIKQVALSGRPAVNLDEERRRTLALWMEKKIVLEGEHVSSGNSLRIQSREARRLFRDGLAVAADQISWAPRPSLFRNPSARGVLVHIDPPLVSYSQVPGLPLEALRAALDAPLNESIILSSDLLELNHVGIQQSEAGEGEKRQINYIFEWGHGFWMSLPARQLHYKNGAIEGADLRLFVADQISQVRFIEKDGLLVLQIEETIPSYGHVLYRQAGLHRIVHPLQIRVPKNGEPEITHIEGFDSGSVDAPRQVIGRDRIGLLPQLDDAGRQIVMQRAAAAGLENWQGVILGRLDVRSFAASHGTEFRFQFVRLDRSGQEGAGHLKTGDRIFAIAQDVVSHGRNNCALIARPLPGLDPRDISSDFREIRITRRLFSFRQQTLLRLHKEEPDALAGRYLLLQLDLDGKSPTGSLKTGSPARHQAVVDMLLAASPRGIFAIYAGPTEKEAILLEFKPGVFVNLSYSQVDMGEDLLLGDVVRVSGRTTASWTRYEVERAMYSDFRYVAGRRPIVVFPMENLAKDRPPYSHSSQRRGAADSFTIGDLPDLRVRLRITEGDRMRVPSDGEMQLVLTAEHPKLAWLEQIAQRSDQNLFAVITPDFANTIRAGRLVISGRVDPAVPDSEIVKTDDAEGTTSGLEERPTGVSHDLKISPLDNGDPATENLQADWFLLTFHDRHADWLQEYVNSRRWSYHDAESISWTSVPRSPVRRFAIGEATAATGPLFFETRDTRAVLRYGPEDLRRYAIGFGNLIGALGEPTVNNQRPPPYVVAGVPDEGGLYVEVAPGRIVEIPPAMAHWGELDNDTVSLEATDWSQFAPGDELDISRMPQPEPYSPERVLLNWRPGVRNSFGPIGAILPQMSIDTLHGAACYGSGQFQVLIPSTDPEALPKLALLGGRDLVQTIDLDTTPIRDSTVLLIMEADGGIGIAGLNSWRAMPDKRWEWDADPLMQSVFRKRQDGSIAVDWSKLRDRVGLAGGALPVTVEWCSSGGALYFSRRHQNPRVPVGRTMLARIVGQVPGSDFLMMIVGGRHFALSCTELVFGLPEQLRATAIERLRASETPVWVRRLNGSFAVGISEFEKGAPSVKSQLVLSDDRGDAIGIICVGTQDRRLRWLPAERAAAAPLSALQAAAVFSKRGRAFQVWTEGNRISLIDHPRVRRELETLQVGERLGVESISSNVDGAHPIWDSEPVPGHKIRLVKSRATGLIMAAAVNGNPGSFLAEVAERRVQHGSVFLLLVPAGQRRIKPDFPKWLAGASESGAPATNRHIFLIDDRDPLPIESSEIVRKFVGLMNGEDPDFQLDGLIHFCAGYRQASTVSLLSGIAAAVMLAASRTTVQPGFASADQDRHLALSKLLDNLGRRALRSFHLEILIRCWKTRLPGQGPSDESRGVTPRIDALLKAIRDQAPLEVCLSSVDRLFDHIALNGGTEYDIALVNALAAGLGRSADLELLWQSCENIAETVRAVRLPMLLDCASSEQCDSAAEALRKVGERMIANRIDIPLSAALT